ncbi:hypothetical protein BpHYR1_012298 [Brachionus plicatilis]|uniref:Uncharacterized protein n=1 Tax=Brachionus plicatilis TaxID=10195 RepID=A0A3M7R7H8_BRAPC|nr:hypothetical protein BpHYR1_012298 [Brachionus plicatilis]
MVVDVRKISAIQLCVHTHVKCFIRRLSNQPWILDIVLDLELDERVPSALSVHQQIAPHVLNVVLLQLNDVRVVYGDESVGGGGDCVCFVVGLGLPIVARVLRRPVDFHPRNLPIGPVDAVVVFVPGGDEQLKSEVLDRRVGQVESVGDNGSFERVGYFGEVQLEVHARLVHGVADQFGRLAPDVRVDLESDETLGR